MREVFLIVFFIVSLGGSLFFAAEWSDWKDLTQCTAKPCKCPGQSRYQSCDTGTKVQIRACVREEGDTDVCNLKGQGPVRFFRHCKNRNVCPGWSEWIPDGTCDCKTGIQKFKRLCINPPPIHPDVICVNEYLDHEEMEGEDYRNCICTEEERRKQEPTTTSTTPEPSTTPLPCCEDHYYNSYADEYDTGSLDGGAFDGGAFDEIGATTTSGPTTSKSEFEKMYDDMYDDLFKSKSQDECRPCRNSTDGGGYSDYAVYY